MNSTVTEAELFTIITAYSDIMASRYEIFVGGVIAMIITIFVTRDTLGIYLRGIIMLIFSMFSYVQYISVTGVSVRMSQLIESMRLVTKDQIDMLPATVGILESPILATPIVSNMTSISMAVTWVCCLILMAYPKLLIKGIKN
ncbi:MAG: hypothetical protein HOH19_12410 [Kordiimonadaceae bacterium]|jgi:hypothetical protein|nr:hypothetical protein [Kordiimonadaceae bacterium]MBT6033370.1 hypothetical protein [Kordiimonadaceae bacterium]